MGYDRLHSYTVTNLGWYKCRIFQEVYKYNSFNCWGTCRAYNIILWHSMRGNEGKDAFMMFKLDSDKWIGKWTGAISISSCFCSRGLLPFFFWGEHQNNSTLIVCFDSVGPGLAQSFNVAWQLLLCPLIFPFLSTLAFLQLREDTSPAVLPVQSLLSFEVILNINGQDLRH